MSNGMDITVTLKDKASKGLKDFRKELNNVDKSAADSTKKIHSMTSAIGALVGITAGGAFLVDTVKTFADFDDNMRAAAAVTGATTEEMKKMTDQAKKMGEETRYSAAQSAEALKFMGMTGFSATEATSALPDVLNLAAAGAMDLGSAADIATNVLTGFGMEVEDLSMVNDVLAKTFTSANTDLVEFGEAFKMVGPVAKGVGEGFTDLSASIGILGNAGIKGTMAGTALKNAIDSLLAPTSAEAQLMDELSERIGGVGLQIQDSEGNFIGFRSIIEQLEKAGLRGDEALQAFGMRAGPAMVAMLNQGSGALKELEADLDNAGGTADRIASQMEEGLGGSLRETASLLEGLKIALGDALDEELIMVLDQFQVILKAIIAEINDLATKGYFEQWGNAAVFVLEKLSNAASGAYNRLHSMALLIDVVALGLTGNFDAAKLAFADFTKSIDSADKVFGTYREEAEQVTEITKEITKEMFATRDAAKELEAETKKVTEGMKASATQVKDFEKSAKKAYTEAEKYAKQYAEQVIAWDERIKENRRSTEDTIRSINRQGLSESEQWADRRKEAEEKLSAAKKALLYDDYELAEKLAADSQTLYAGLAEEVSKEDATGQSVVVKSLEQTKKIAISGIEEVSSFNEKLFTEQKKNAEKSQQTWEKAMEVINTKLEELTKDRQTNVDITLDNLASVQSALAQLTRNETKTIYVKTVQTNKEGGPVYGFNTGAFIPRSGALPGYGGGDKVKSLLEPGEGILRKEAMDVIGVPQLNAWNALKFNMGGAVPSFSGSTPSFKGTSGPGETLTLRFQAGENEAAVNVTDSDSQMSLRKFAELLEKKRLTHVE